MKTDTPKTDKAIEEAAGLSLSGYCTAMCMHARELERENARLRDGLIRLDALYRSELDDAPPRPKWLDDILSNAASEQQPEERTRHAN